MVHWRRRWHPLQYSCLEHPMNDMTLEDQVCRCKDVHYATEEEQRAITTSSRKSEGRGAKVEMTAADVSGGERKV